MQSSALSQPAVSWRSLLQRYGLLLSFLLLCVGLSLLSDRFLTPQNLINVLRQATINGIIAVGMTFVILTAGIDLSVGAVLALSAVITADLLQKGTPPAAAIAAGLAIGAGLGAVNGLIVARTRVPPFIATLGMMTVARGLALTYTQGRPITGLPPEFRVLGTGSLGPVPMPVVVAGLVFLAGYLLLERTRHGQAIRAIGNNPTAARYAGIPTRGYVALVYVLSGLLAALAGIILTGRLNSAQPTAGLGYEFDAIAAVVVGGTSFSGGEGSLFGTLLGVLVIAVLNNGLNLLNVSSFWQPVVTGAVIALALLLYRAIR
ncbi:MAG: ABC transporter permease [Caldilineales bacterium]|nr:ABC transporter permease [Caldilineales bacterium]MDW8317893.1 ABC transporter permease [Anaerolineae bacterium]